MAGREGWKTATAERVEKPEQKRGRNTDTHIHPVEEVAKPQIKAAITAGKLDGSSGGSPKIHRTPTQPGIGSLSPYTVSPGAPQIWGRKQTQCPLPRTLIWGAEDILPPSHTRRRHYKHRSPGGSRYSRRDWTETAHRAMPLCVPAHTHSQTTIMDR